MIPKIDPETGIENKPEDLCAICLQAHTDDQGNVICPHNLPPPKLVELPFRYHETEINYACESFIV